MKIDEELVEKITNCDWLSHCGIVEDIGIDVKYVASMKEAEMHMGKLKWENMCIDARGDATEIVFVKNKEAHNRYCQQIGDEVDAAYIEPVVHKIEKAVQELADVNDKENVAADIIFNLVGIFFCNYFSEYVKSPFFDDILKIYLSGHLPCGWDGKRSKGRFMIY